VSWTLKRGDVNVNRKEINRLVSLSHVRATANCVFVSCSLPEVHRPTEVAASLNDMGTIMTRKLRLSPSNIHPRRVSLSSRLHSVLLLYHNLPNSTHNMVLPRSAMRGFSAARLFRSSARPAARAVARRGYASGHGHSAPSSDIPW
jgi:hypothetical protein